MSDLTEIRDASRAFIADREWQQFQNPKSILLALVGEVGELAELLQWLPADEARDRLREEPLNTRVSEEMADVLVYLVGLADQCGVDLGSATLAKINASVDKYPADQNRGIAPDKLQIGGKPACHRDTGKGPGSMARSRPSWVSSTSSVCIRIMTSRLSRV